MSTRFSIRFNNSINRVILKKFQLYELLNKMLNLEKRYVGHTENVYSIYLVFEFGLKNYKQERCCKPLIIQLISPL